MKLNLGCGAKPRDGYVNVDRAALPGVDVVWDLDRAVWPTGWAGAAEEVLVEHLFEHVEDPLLFMARCHWALQPGGLLHIEVPHWRSENAYTDPTHRRYCTERTFDYWVPGTELHDAMGAAYAGERTFTYEAPPVVDEWGNLIVYLRKETA